MKSLKKVLGGSGSEPQTIPAPKGEKELCAEMGLRPIDNFAETDIFIAGYPKSGNTWMQYLVAGAFCGIDLSVTPDALVQDLAPDVHFKKFYKPYFPVTFFKTHFLPRPDYRKVVYLLRDGRDVLVSYWHYLQGLCNEEINFAEMVRIGDKFFPCKWHEHVERWLDNPYRAEMITVRYEDLKTNTVSELARIADFAGLKPDRAVLEAAAQAASFSAMKRREESFAWENPQIPRNGQFVRRGQVGSHRDEMPADAREVFLREAGSALKRTGYIA